MTTRIAAQTDSWGAVEKAIAMRKRDAGTWESHVNSGNHGIEQWPEPSDKNGDVENAAGVEPAPGEED